MSNCVQGYIQLYCPVILQCCSDLVLKQLRLHIVLLHRGQTQFTKNFLQILILSEEVAFTRYWPLQFVALKGCGSKSVYFQYTVYF